MPIGIALDHGEQFRVVTGKALQESIIVFERLGVDLNPARPHWHPVIQSLV
jgi:hypothetical protein